MGEDFSKAFKGFLVRTILLSCVLSAVLTFVIVSSVTHSEQRDEVVAVIKTNSDLVKEDEFFERELQRQMISVCATAAGGTKDLSYFIRNHGGEIVAINHFIAVENGYDNYYTIIENGERTQTIKNEKYDVRWVPKEDE